MNFTLFKNIEIYRSKFVDLNLQFTDLNLQFKNLQKFTVKLTNLLEITDHQTCNSVLLNSAKVTPMKCSRK